MSLLGYFQLRKNHCQLHAFFFAVPAILIFLLTGCRDRSTSAYEHLRAQLLRETFDALNGHASDRAHVLLTRLEDLSPDQPFWRLAAAREEERRCLREFNRLMSTGQFEKARIFVRSETAKLGVSGALSEAADLPEALLAMQAYIARPPATDSRTAQSALRGLAPHAPLLEASPIFVAWHQAEIRKIAA